mgnify:CR=1 FL=1
MGSAALVPSRLSAGSAIFADRDVSVTARGLRELVDGTQKELLLQTPYLVLSDEAQAMFRQLHARAQPPRAGRTA